MNIRKNSWISEKVKVKLNSFGEKGLFLMDGVKKGECVMIFGGKVLDHATDKTIQIDEKIHVESGDVDDYMNHSCEPNCYVDWKDLSVYSLRYIFKEEELTYDYNTSDYEFIQSFRCLCGSSHCYGEIKGFKFLTKEQKEKIKEYVSPYLENKI